MAIEELSPNTKVIAVEPEGAKTLGVSLQDNKVSKLDEVCSFADGVAVRQIGSHPFEIIKDRIDGYVSVTNDEICSAIQQIHEDTRAIAECSGAVGLAGATKYLKEHSLKDANVAVILSGSNINFQKLEYVAQRYNLGNCHEKLLHLTIPERKGELVKLLTLLNDVNITEIKYRRSDSDDTATLVLGFSSDDVHFLDMKVELLKYTLGYTVKDFSSLDIGKSHLRFMVGDSKFGSTVQSEKFYRLEFPEKKGQLLNVIEKASSDIEVTALNYRNSGQNECSVLIGIDSKQTSKFPVKLSLENFCKVESIALSF
jgi:threonine dehydratase